VKLLTFLAGSEHRLGALHGDRIIDLNLAHAAMLAARGETQPHQAAAAIVPAELEALLCKGDAGMVAAREALAWAAGRDAPEGPAGERMVYRLDEARLAAPIRRPEKIIGIGLNYRDHCREMGRDLPTEIRTFGMFANALIGPGAAIRLPWNSEQMDWEAELVAVIGKPARHVTADQALGYVAGYTIGNDISARDHQKADPATMRGKSGDTHAPTGPWLVTSDEIQDPGILDLELKVNGVVKQSSNTAELVFPVATLVSFLSRYFTLLPGDLIFTGTPAGVGAGRRPPEWLTPGDRIDITVDRIGTLSNVCVAEPKLP
jgi:acylpyruvate hydrolase